MIDNVYPIAYLGGSGGAFLSSWLNEAAHGMPVVLCEKTGNAHGSGKYGGFSIFTEQQHAIELLKKKYIDCPIKLFIASHIVDNDILMSSFHKCTKITYDQDDILDIAISFYAKNKEFLRHEARDFIKVRLDATEQFNKAMSVRLPESAHHSNVSWKDLLYSEPSYLINYLSSFYELDSEKFNIEALNKWRTLTLNNILTIRPFVFGDAG